MNVTNFETKGHFTPLLSELILRTCIKVPFGKRKNSGQQYRHSHFWFLLFAIANDALSRAFVSRIIAFDSPENGPHVLCGKHGGKETHFYFFLPIID